MRLWRRKQIRSFTQNEKTSVLNEVSLLQLVLFFQYLSRQVIVHNFNYELLFLSINALEDETFDLLHITFAETLYELS